MNYRDHLFKNNYYYNDFSLLEDVEQGTVKKLKNEEKSIMSKIGDIISKAGYYIQKGVRGAANWISQKIGSLRNLANAWRKKAVFKRALGKTNIIEEIIERVLSAIDWALAKLESFLRASNANATKYGLSTHEVMPHYYHGMLGDTVKKVYNNPEEGLQNVLQIGQDLIPGMFDNVNLDQNGIKKFEKFKAQLPPAVSQAIDSL